MAGLFGELVRLSPAGRVVAKTRISHGRAGIQPVIVPLTETRAVAFLRNIAAGRDALLTARTEDGGQTWSSLEKMELPNPNSPVAAVRLSSGAILLVFNPARNTLSLAVSTDGGKRFTRIYTVDSTVNSAPGNRKRGVRYPSLLRHPDGSLVLTYSRRKQGIRVVRFTEAWVERQLPPVLAVRQ
jgi:predicted neuraminidase